MKKTDGISLFRINPADGICSTFSPVSTRVLTSGKNTKSDFIGGFKILVFMLILCLSLSPFSAEHSLAQNAQKETKKTSSGKSASSTAKTEKSSSKSTSSKKASAQTSSDKTSSTKTTPAKKTSSGTASAKSEGKKSAGGNKAKSEENKASAKAKSKKSTQSVKSAQSSKKSKSAQTAAGKKKAKSRGASRYDDAPTKEVVQASKQVNLSSPVIGGPDLFARPVQARVYKFRDSNADWLLPNESPESVGKALAVLRPSLVSNFALFYNGALPGEDEIDSLREIRRKVTQVSPNSKFEIVLDARDYKSPAEVTSHMRALAERVDFELFFFSGLEAVYERSPEIATAAIAEAHAQNRLAGATFNSKVVPQLDYLSVYAGDGEEDLKRRISAAQTRLPILATMDNESSKLQLDKNYAGGKEFVSKKTPAERRKLVTSLAKKQDSLNFRMAYPLFFPMQAASKSYDALRDEFMRDTLRRLTDEHNSKPGKVASKAVLD